MPKLFRSRLFKTALLSFLTGLAVLIGCSGGNAPVPNKPASNKSESPDGPPWFEEITDKVGLNFSHDPGEDLEQYRLYECMGSGCAIADLDGDGLPDLILLTNAGPLSKSTNKIYRQKKDHTFEDVTIGSGIDFPGWNMGIAIGDVNNDGKPDILITQYNGVKLLLNKGGMKFEDVTNESGLINLQWGASAAFLDFDRDGWLDLCIVNYVLFDPSRPCQGPVGHKGNEWFFRPEYCGPRKFAGSASKLFRNRGRELTEAKNPKGPRVSFEDVSMKSGIGGKTGPGLGIAVADFDGDGWPDIFITNDMEPNCLWMNKRDGTFTEEAMARGVARSARGDANAGMGIAIGDASNTGLLDLYVTHLAMQTNILWKQGPPGSFRDVTAAWGLNALRWNGTGFGTVMADFDNDGWVDIAIVNGGIVRPKQERKKPGLSPHWEPYGERNQVLANVEGKKFRDISHNNPAFCEYFTVARGLACGDIDGNGSLDLLVNATGEKARLFKNVAPNRGHWVSVRAFDPSCHRDAIGAKVVARTDNIQRVRMIGSGESYLSACPLVAHFGLGKADKVDEYEVTWPDGTRERFSGGPVDRSIELRRGSGIR